MSGQLNGLTSNPTSDQRHVVVWYRGSCLVRSYLYSAHLAIGVSGFKWLMCLSLCCNPLLRCGRQSLRSALCGLLDPSLWRKACSKASGEGGNSTCLMDLSKMSLIYEEQLEQSGEEDDDNEPSAMQCAACWARLPPPSPSVLSRNLNLAWKSSVSNREPLTPPFALLYLLSCV